MMSISIEKVRKRTLNEQNNDKAKSSSLWIFGNNNDSQKCASVSNSENHLLKVEDMEFSVFYRQPEVQKLRNNLLYEKYYTRAVIDTEQASVELVLPNLKQFSDVIV